jgi:phage gp46-like protein
MDAWINPATGAYEAGSGAQIGTLLRDPADGLANALYLRLMTPLGSWFGDVTLGSRLHELVREKDKARVEMLAAQYARQALQPVVDDGRALSITVATQRSKDDALGGRLNLTIEVVDAFGAQRTFELPVQVA